MARVTCVIISTLRGLVHLAIRMVPIVKEVWGGRLLPFPTLVNRTTRTKENFGVGSLPSVVLINPNGHVAEGGKLEMLEKELASTDAQP